MMSDSLSPNTANIHTDKPSAFVSDNASLKACIKILSEQDALAFDLEFDSHRHAYGVTLCLVQVATPGACFIIDPLADIDLSELYDLFSDERIGKIVHSPGEDLRILHGLGCYPKNLFDTEVVARLLNYEQTSLSAMLDAKLGYSLNKAQQRSNWLLRPLTKEQLRYAAEDVTGLHALKQILVEEAIGRGIMSFVEEEQAALSTTIYQQERKGFFLKTGDINNLSPYEQYVLNALFVYRDELAQGLNRPAYQVMDESLLRDIAYGKVSPQEAPFAKGVYGGYRNDRFGRQLASRLDAIHKEAEAQGLSRRRPPRQYLPEARINKAELLEQREAIFTPVQQELAARFGEHAGRFILSNGTVNDILRGAMKIGNIKRRYKQELICDIASEKGIDISPYV
jgi:ribonuclease D